MSLRLRRGLLWKRSYWLPTIQAVINTVATVLAAVVIYLAIAIITFSTRAEAAEADVQVTTGALVALLNGRSIQSTDGTWAAACENVITEGITK